MILFIFGSNPPIERDLSKMDLFMYSVFRSKSFPPIWETDPWRKSNSMRNSIDIDFVEPHWIPEIGVSGFKDAFVMGMARIS